jgi:sugar (pentulose or hexulose) kinase
MFPIDSATGDYDAALLARFDGMAAARGVPWRLRELLPDVRPAGGAAGALTAEGARLLDPTGALRPGALAAPPEGDAGTGMVATNAIAPRTGNVSAGTSIFAMAVLERPIKPHAEIDMVTTPVGDPVAMVHCNNGASELDAWCGLFGEFAAAAGVELAPDQVFGAAFRAALAGEKDAGGVVAYNYLAGEPVTGLAEGRPLVYRSPGADFTLGNFMRAQLYGAFATLALGMRILDGEGVTLDSLFAHGGVFRTAGVAQPLLAAALGVPITTGETAGEGGAWGMAVLAAYAALGEGRELAAYLSEEVFQGAATTTASPDPADQAGFAEFLNRYSIGLAVERAAVEAGA